LIQNAIKFSDKNNSFIRVQWYKKHKKYILAVEDNGNGVENLDISKIFDKYTI